MTPEEQQAAARAEMERLMGEANDIAHFIMKKLERYKARPGKKAATIDARAVSMACSRVAGTYLSMVSDPVVRQHYRDQFPVLFQKIMDAVAMPKTGDRNDH